MSGSLGKEHLELLLKVNSLLSSSLSIDVILELLMDQVVEVLKAERGFILLYDEEHGEWEFKTARAIDQETVRADSFGISRGVIDEVRQGGRAILTSDAQSDSRFRDQVSVGLHCLRSILCAPIMLGKEVRGVIYTDHRMETGLFSSAQKELLGAIADQAGRALENASLYQKLQRVHQESMEKARQELAETQAQLVQTSKLAAVGQLAAGLAHEVNNPLGAIALNVNALGKMIDDAVGRRRLELVRAAVARCQGIIQRLLRFSQPHPIERRTVELQKLLKETLQLLEPSLTAEKIELRLGLEPACVQGDPDQLSQVFMNLLLNARDALRGRPGPALQVRCGETPEGMVRVVVVDNGCGMSEQTRQRIFEPFFTTKEVGEGVGLGLSVGYRVLQEHGAEIQIASQEGQGTRFEIVFPKEVDNGPDSCR